MHGIKEVVSQVVEDRNRLVCDEQECVSRTEAVALLQAAELRRIADALERLAGARQPLPVRESTPPPEVARGACLGCGAPEGEEHREDCLVRAMEEPGLLMVPPDPGGRGVYERCMRCSKLYERFEGHRCPAV